LPTGSACNHTGGGGGWGTPRGQGSVCGGMRAIVHVGGGTTTPHAYPFTRPRSSTCIIPFAKPPLCLTLTLLLRFLPLPLSVAETGMRHSDPGPRWQCVSAIRRSALGPPDQRGGGVRGTGGGTGCPRTLPDSGSPHRCHCAHPGAGTQPRGALGQPPHERRGGRAPSHRGGACRRHGHRHRRSSGGAALLYGGTGGRARERPPRRCWSTAAPASKRSSWRPDGRCGDPVVL
jgi:hypothetical protein